MPSGMFASLYGFCGGCVNYELHLGDKQYVNLLLKRFLMFWNLKELELADRMSFEFD